MSLSEESSSASTTPEPSDHPEQHTPEQATTGGVEVSAPSTAVKAQRDTLSSQSSNNINHNMSLKEPNNETEQSASQIPEDVDTDDAELPAFDDQDFRRRWMEALAAADENEQKLYREFNAYADVSLIVSSIIAPIVRLSKAFQLWSGTSSQKDSERAVKR
jgi:hypothetical protein